MEFDGGPQHIIADLIVVLVILNQLATQLHNKPKCDV